MSATLSDRSEYSSTVLTTMRFQDCRTDANGIREVNVYNYYSENEDVGEDKDEMGTIIEDNDIDDDEVIDKDAVRLKIEEREKRMLKRRTMITMKII